MALTKPAGTWDYADLAALPDDGTRYEIIDGELYKLPSPTWAHAIVIAGLVRLLIPVLDRLGGRWVTAPLEVSSPGPIPYSQTSSYPCPVDAPALCDEVLRVHLIS